MGRLTITNTQGPDEFQRAVLLKALHEFYVPVQRDELQAYASAFANPPIEIPVLDQVVALAEATWSSGSSEAVWLCPALRAPDGAADSQYLTRSDWRLENRLVGVGTQESRSLWLVRVFCDLYVVGVEEQAEVLEPLVGQIRKHSGIAGSRLAGVVTLFLDNRKGELDVDAVEQLREAAEDAYSTAAADERSAFRAMARRLESLNESQRLFGT